MENRKLVSKCSKPILKLGKQSLDTNKTFLSTKFYFKSFFFFILLPLKAYHSAFYVVIASRMISARISIWHDKKILNLKIVTKCSTPIQRPGKQSLGSNKIFIIKILTQKRFLPLYFGFKRILLYDFAFIRLQEELLKEENI